VSYLTFAHTNDSVTIVCIRDGKILLQREYSYPVSSVLYQFPGGKVEVSETPRAAAKRELQEESGYTVQSIRELGWYYPNNRRSAAKMYVFLAESVTEAEKQGGDQEEDIQSEWVTIANLESKISSREIVNFSVLAA
jgi:ADP-ribose pyrophosphatase